MAISVVMEFPGASAQQYDAVMRDLDLGANPADGGLIHVAGPTEDGWRVIDVWESQAKLDTFVRDRLGALLARHGVPQPRLTPGPVHNMFGAAPQ